MKKICLIYFLMFNKKNNFFFNMYCYGYKLNCMGIVMFCNFFSYINILYFSGWYCVEIEDNKS